MNINYYQAIGNLFGVQFLSSMRGEFNWYLAGIIVCYLLTPYLASFIEKNDMAKNLSLIGILLLISISFWNDIRAMILITRLPIYTLGMLFSKHEQKMLTKKFVLATAAGFIIGNISLWEAFRYMPDYLGNYGLYWYPFILIVPFFVIVVSLVSEWFARNKTGKKFVGLISVIGDYCFEIFLVHVFMFEHHSVMLKVLSFLLGILPFNTEILFPFGHGNRIWLLTFLSMIPFVILLRRVSNFIRRIFIRNAN